jgi:hypothetical protein
MKDYCQFVYPNPAITQVIDAGSIRLTGNGGTPVAALPGDANRIRAILSIFHNAALTVVIGPLDGVGTGINDLAAATLENPYVILRIEDYGDLIKQPLYVREVSGGAYQAVVSFVRYTNPTLLI